MCFRNYRFVRDPTEVGCGGGGGRSGSLLLENCAHGFTCHEQHREAEKASYLVMYGTSKAVCAILRGGAGGSIWLSIPIPIRKHYPFPGFYNPVPGNG